jgi:hypothetical protein
MTHKNDTLAYGAGDRVSERHSLVRWGLGRCPFRFMAPTDAENRLGFRAVLHLDEPVGVPARAQRTRPPLQWSCRSQRPGRQDLYWLSLNSTHMPNPYRRLWGVAEPIRRTMAKALCGGSRR